MPIETTANTPVFHNPFKATTSTAGPKHPLVVNTLAPLLAPVGPLPEHKFHTLPRKASNVPLWLNRPVAKPSRATLRPEPEPTPPSPVASSCSSNPRTLTEALSTAVAVGVEEADASLLPSSTTPAVTPRTTRTLSIIDGVFSGIWKEDFHPSPFSRRPSNSPSVTTNHSRFSSRRSSSTPPTSIPSTIPSTIPVASTSSGSKFVEALPSDAPEYSATPVQHHQTVPPWLKQPTRTKSQQPSKDDSNGQIICADYDYTQAINVLLDKPCASQPTPQNYDHPRSESRLPSMLSRRQSIASFDSFTSWQCVSSIPDDAGRAQRGRQRRKLKKRCVVQGSTTHAKAKPSLFTSALFSHSASASAR
jgi:hypothetical protein